MTRTRWRDLTGRQRALAFVGAVVQMTLQALALRDLRRRPSDDVRGPKGLWFLATFVNTIGPIAYFLLGRRRPPARVNGPHP
jgi:hypothetical protein